MSSPAIAEQAPRPFRPNRTVGGWPDWILLLVLLSSIAPFGLFWTIEPSWPRDLVSFFVLIVTGLAGKPWQRVSPTVWWLSAAYAGACTIGLFVWSVELDSSLALNFWSGWSPWLVSGGLLIFSLAYGKARWAEWNLLFIGLGVGIAVIQAFGVIAALSGLANNAAQISDYGDFYGTRPVHAGVALLMLLGFLLMLTRHLDRRWQYVLATFLGLSVVISQHRSVWVGLAVVVLLLVIAMARHRYPTGRLPLAITVGYMALALVLPMVSRISILPVATEAAKEPGLPDVVASSRTLEWRLDMWESRLVAPRGMSHWLFGGVFGVNPVKWPGTGVMNPYNTAHNMAVDLLVMFGIVGVVLVGALFVLAAILRSDRLDPQAIFLWALLGFGIFYYWPTWSWVLVGVALATRADRPEPVSGPSSETTEVASTP